jgi:small GTP-binding protein
MGGQESRVEYRTDPAVLTLIEQMTQQNKQYAEQFRLSEERFNVLIASMQEKDITSFAELEEKDAKLAEKLIQLAQSAPTLQMTGKNYGFFGDTGSGKSTMLNTLIDKPGLAPTGYGETTTEITPYDGVNFRVWDIPGSNDEINYLTLSYISCIKGLTKRGIIVINTIKEQTKLIHLLQKLNLSFFIIVNKIDHVQPDELEHFQKRIRNERDQFCAGANVYFVTAKNKTACKTEWKKLLEELS